MQNKYTFDFNLGRYRGSKFQNPSFYLHYLADTWSVKLVKISHLEPIDDFAKEGLPQFWEIFAMISWAS